MGQLLGADEFAILQGHADAGDRIAYYSQLAAWGYDYGNLALAVVNNDGIAGAAANWYFETETNADGTPLTHDQLADLSHQLMLADFDAREEFGGVELSADRVWAYHQSVLTRFDVDPDAWTPHTLFAAIEEYAGLGVDTSAIRDLIWTSYVQADDPAGVLISGFTTFMTTHYLTLGEQLSGDFADAFGLTAYFGQVALAAANGAIVSQSNDYGPYEFALPTADGTVFGGGYLDDYIEGSEDNDVIMGFDGDDDLFGRAGSDRLYGADGDDQLYGNEGDDILIGGNGADFIEGGDGNDIVNLGISHFMGIHTAQGANDYDETGDKSDGNADVIIIGEGTGTDTILGKGDAEDRIVLRINDTTAVELIGGAFRLYSGDGIDTSGLVANFSSWGTVLSGNTLQNDAVGVRYH